MLQNNSHAILFSRRNSFLKINQLCYCCYYDYFYLFQEKVFHSVIKRTSWWKQHIFHKIPQKVKILWRWVILEPECQEKVSKFIGKKILAIYLYGDWHNVIYFFLSLSEIWEELLTWLLHIHEYSKSGNILSKD